MLKRIKLKGFKSIKELDLEIRPLNILIGANGVGKSNLISFFKMLNEMMAGRLQQYIGTSGGSQTLLHFGAKVTPEIEAQLEFENEYLCGQGIEEFKLLNSSRYNLKLSHAAGDTLIFAEEILSLLQKVSPKPKRQYKQKIDSLGAGHQETKIRESARSRKHTAQVIEGVLSRCHVYHFHDTSSTAPVRQSCYIGDNRWLMPDAANLAALLFRFSKENDKAYQRIVSTIRLIAPFFDDFDLRPENNRIMLEWRHQGSDQVFGAHQLSDGTLRAICLTTLLLQPTTELPELIIIDEPELGLHPYALNVVAGMLGKASQNTQILISTQSSSFLDNFEPEDVITINREDQASKFTRLKSEDLAAWLEEYSLGQIWEKNAIGGGPH